MSDEIKIDKATFESRISSLQTAWKDKKNDAFNGVKCILSVMGRTEDGPYSKSLALHVRKLWITPPGGLGQTEG